MKGMIILRHIKVENANAIAGNTWGFPAVASFLGFSHALQRQLNAKSGGRPLTLLGCGIVCHRHQAQVHQTHDFGDHLFALTRNPLDKSGSSSAFNEEGRMHMDVSLVIPYDGRIRDIDEVATLIGQLALRQRLAGGTITDIKSVKIEPIDAYAAPEKTANRFKRIMRSLLPGFALVSRQSTLAKHQQLRQQQAGPLSNYGCTDTDLAAWLEFAALTTSAEIKDEATEDGEPVEAEQGKTQWLSDNHPYGGWLRPIAVGYRAISPLYPAGQVANTRDTETPVRFVETLYSLGEWLSPHRLKTIDDLYWYYHHDANTDQYLCVNQYINQNELSESTLSPSTEQA